MSGTRLGELMVKENLISPTQLTQALEQQKKNGGRLGSSLVKLGFVNDEDVTTFLSRQYGVPSINLSYFEVDPEVVKLVPEETARRYEIVPLSRVGSSLTIAMVDPTNVFAMDDIKFMTGFNVEPVVASESSIREALDKFYAQVQGDALSKAMEELGGEGDEVLELEAEETELAAGELEKAATEAPVVKLVNIILREALTRGASDIHMEPYEKEYRIRFRIDGALQAVMSPPLKMRDAIISRLKIMSKLDIAEKRLPQDGRIMLRMHQNGKKKQLDLRVSV
ncbi:MAG: Flp pilus assembly complex ATPase component TadA, partial [Acidobacteria bacterium]|nr:Flp pilus assembly complex ATPase component TadA [Acidobacteriota bacterium]